MPPGCHEGPKSVLFEAGDTQANPVRRPPKISIPRHQDDFVITQFKRGRQTIRSRGSVRTAVVAVVFAR